MTATNVRIDWFEIPVKDLSRAASFYSTILQTELGDLETPGGPLKTFQSDGGPIGALALDSTNAPSQSGALLYLGTDDIEATLSRVEGAGGKVVKGKTSIGPYGFIAEFLDTEQNRVALHSS